MQKRLAAFIMSLTLTFSAMPNFVSAATDGERTILYVATDGNDSNSGSIDSPFATIEHARDVLRQMNKNGEIGSKGAVVYLRGGTYSQVHSIDFTEADSGKEGAPIVYRGYPGEDVTIFAGANVPANELDKVTDEAVLSKLINKNSAKNLYQISFDKIGIDSDMALLYLNQTYGALGTAINEFNAELGHYGEELKTYLGLPKTRDTPLKVMADDSDLDYARYPDEGYMYVSKPITQYSIIAGEEDRKKYGISQDGLAEQRYKEMLSGKPPAYPSFLPDQAEHTKLWAGRDLKNVLFSGNVAVGWSTECLLLKEVKDDGTIVSQNATYWEPIKVKDPFYIYNFFDEITENEFYFDTDKDIMYVCLPKDPSKYKNIKISLLEAPIFNIDKVSYMDIKDIHFTFSAGETVLINDSKNVVVDNCEVSQTMKKNRAMYISGNSENCGIKNSYFHNVNGGPAIWASNSTEGSRTQKMNCFLVNCEIEEFSEINKTGAVAFHIEGTGNYAKYNKAHGGDHQGVLFGGWLNSITFNEVYDVCRNTDDAAAIYAGQTWVRRGLLLGYNYIHDLGSSSGGAKLGVNGIYLDDLFSRADVVGNVVENIPDYGIFLGGGNGNGIYNNIIINCGGGIWCDDRGYDKTGIFFTSRVKEYYAWGDIFGGDDVKALFPDLENLDFDTMRIPANIYKKNVIYNSGGISMQPIAQKTGTFEDNVVTNEDPGFADLSKKNYTLNENSAVAKKIDNFMPIPFTRMGQCTDRAMNRIKAATVFAIDSPKAFVNGTEVSIDDNQEVVPVIIDGKTYLPIRFLAEANEFDVEYNDEDKTASFTSDAVSLNINTVTGEMILNGEKSEENLDIVVKHDRTFVPMRVVSEMLGKYVFWNDRGFVSVSSIDQLFSDKNDDEIIDYIFNKLYIY